MHRIVRVTSQATPWLRKERKGMVSLDQLPELSGMLKTCRASRKIHVAVPSHVAWVLHDFDSCHALAKCAYTEAF